MKKDSISVTTVCPGGLNTTTRLCYQNKKVSWFTRLSVLNPEDAASISVRGMLNGKRIVIPGFVNKCFIVIDKLIPKFVKDYLANREIKKLELI